MMRMAAALTLLLTGHQLDSSNAIKALRVLEGQDVPEAMEGLIQKLSEHDMSALRREIIGLTR